MLRNKRPLVLFPQVTIKPQYPKASTLSSKVEGTDYSDLNASSLPIVDTMKPIHDQMDLQSKSDHSSLKIIHIE